LSYSVKQGNVFGRLGESLGKALSDQVPKEVERMRLSKGLQELGQQEDQTPFQQFAGLAGLPGITPQMIQTGGELLKNQGMRNSLFRKAGGGQGTTGAYGQELGIPSQENVPNMSPLQRQISVEQQTGNIPSSFASEGAKAASTQTSPQRNPLSKELIPAKPWTPDRWNRELSDMARDFPNASFEDIKKMAQDKENRELAQPASEQAIDSYREDVKHKADKEFDRQFQTKVQKTGDASYADLPGAMQLNVKKAMGDELIKNPNMSLDQAADKYSEIAYNNGRALNKVNEISKSPFRNSPSETLNKLMSARTPFAKAGNLDTYKSILQDDKDGFGFSPQRASHIAFKPTPQVEKYISNHKRGSTSNIEQNSRKVALDIEDILTKDDSLLSIVSHLKDKDPYFDESAAFAQWREDESKLSPRQIEELTEGVSSIFPKAADLWFFPFRTGIRGGK